MGDRRLHVIGSYPAAMAEDAICEMLGKAAPHLTYLPDGETGERRDRIVHIINGLRGHPDLRVRAEGDRRATRTS